MLLRYSRAVNVHLRLSNRCSGPEKVCANFSTHRKSVVFHPHALRLCAEPLCVLTVPSAEASDQEGSLTPHSHLISLTYTRGAGGFHMLCVMLVKYERLQAVGWVTLNNRYDC